MKLAFCSRKKGECAFLKVRWPGSVGLELTGGNRSRKISFKFEPQVQSEFEIEKTWNNSVGSSKSLWIPNFLSNMQLQNQDSTEEVSKARSIQQIILISSINCRSRKTQKGLRFKKKTAQINP